MLEVELEPDRQPDPVLLTLSRRQAEHIEVRVVSPDDAPVAGAFVFLEEEGKGARILTTAADGTVSAALQPPIPARARAAAIVGNLWALGDWVAGKQAREGITLTLSGHGGLSVESEQRQGSPRILSPNGWDLSWLLRLLGSPVFLSPDQPLRLEGLPPGSYTVALDDVSLVVAVRAGELVDARLHNFYRRESRKPKISTLMALC